MRCVTATSRSKKPSTFSRRFPRYGLRDRGRLAAGAHADVIVFDPATVGPVGERTLDDLPGGASRIVAESSGMHHVLVAGTEIVRDGAYTGATPGTVLRSGRDTQTVHPAKEH